MADKIMCVYKIINTANGKFYVGSTVDFARRKREHLWELRKRIHCNLHLQNSYIKHGAEVFKFEILTRFHDYLTPCLWTIEQRYIDTLQPEYNIQKTVTSFAGSKDMPEDIKMLRPRKPKKKRTPADPENTRKLRSEIASRPKNLERLRSPKFIAAANTKRSERVISKEQKRKHSVSMMGNTNNLNGSAKNWIFIRPDGIKEEVYNLSKYCQENNLKYQSLLDLFRGKTKHHKGYKVEAVNQNSTP